MMSQVDLAPRRAGPKVRDRREDGRGGGEAAASGRELAGGGGGLAEGALGGGVVVDFELELAEVAGGLDDGALEDRELRRARRDDGGGLGQQDGDVQLVHELAGGFDRQLVAAVDQSDTFGLQLDRGDGGGLQRRFGDQGGDLGVGFGGLIGPAGAFADVDEGDGGDGGDGSV